jgi:hypothetical protein
MKHNELTILSIEALSDCSVTAGKMGATNTLPLPSTCAENGYVGSGAIGFTLKDSQNIVVVGIGGFIVP